MAPVPDNLTSRVFFDYVTGNLATSQEHTCMVRYISGTTTATAVQTSFLALLNGFTAGAFRQNWRVTAVRVSQPSTNFSVLIPTLPALAAFLGTSVVPYQTRFETVEDSMEGRSPTSGRRVSISLYRADNDADATFRYGMPAAVQSALATGLTAQTFMTADTSAPVFYTYVNQNYNSYWERQLRS